MQIFGSHRSLEPEMTQRSGFSGSKVLRYRDRIAFRNQEISGNGTSSTAAPVYFTGLVGRNKSSLEIASHLRAGQKISKSSGSFEILKTLGEGATGVAFLAVNKETGELFVIKKVKLQQPGAVSSEQAAMATRLDREAAMREVKLLSGLIECPYIVRYEGAFYENDELNIVMEYVERGTLSQLIRDHTLRHEQIPERQVWHFLLTVGSALVFLHSRNIVHRDIKSSNILVTKDFVAKVADLGLAASSTSVGSRLRTGRLGTICYMPPEIVEEKPYDGRADVWSLGIVLYECCTGKVPFDARDIASLQRKLRRFATQKLPSLPDLYSSELNQVISRCLTYDPAARPTAIDLLRIPEVVEQAKLISFDLPPLPIEPEIAATRRPRPQSARTPVSGGVVTSPLKKSRPQSASAAVTHRRAVPSMQPIVARNFDFDTHPSDDASNPGTQEMFYPYRPPKEPSPPVQAKPLFEVEQPEDGLDDDQADRRNDFVSSLYVGEIGLTTVRGDGETLAIAPIYRPPLTQRNKIPSQDFVRPDLRSFRGKSNTIEKKRGESQLEGWDDDPESDEGFDSVFLAPTDQLSNLLPIPKIETAIGNQRGESDPKLSVNIARPPRSVVPSSLTPSRVTTSVAIQSEPPRVVPSSAAPVPPSTKPSKRRGSLSRLPAPTQENEAIGNVKAASAEVRESDTAPRKTKKKKKKKSTTAESNTRITTLPTQTKKERLKLAESQRCAGQRRKLNKALQKILSQGVKQLETLETLLVLQLGTTLKRLGLPWVDLSSYIADHRDVYRIDSSGAVSLLLPQG